MTPFAETLWAAPNPRAEFPTTLWGVVLTAADPAAPEAEDSLEKLCATYWLPVYRFIRHQGRGREDAQDLAQGLFRRLSGKTARPAGRSGPRPVSCLPAPRTQAFSDRQRALRPGTETGRRRPHVSFERPSEAEADLLALVVTRRLTGPGLRATVGVYPAGPCAFRNAAAIHGPRRGATV